MQIVKLNDVNFKIPGGYAICKGYALKSDKGYVAFNHDNGMPYAPKGGKKALQSILDAGGFVSFDGMSFVNPM